VFDLPSTKQGLILYKQYAERQIKDYQRSIKLMVKTVEECELRLNKISEGEKNEQVVSG
jgi:hypothetical protein